MCNRYAQRGSVSAIRQLAKAMNKTLKTTAATDNLPPREDVYPDQDAPVIINTDDGNLELTIMRWGFPPIPSETTPITNIRNLQSRWWRDTNREYLLSAKYRCLVPFTSYAEPVRDPTWFEIPGYEVACFAGILRPWEGERLAEQPGQKRRSRQQGHWNLFAFLTTEPNDVVRPIHPKAMPVILIDPNVQVEWLSGTEASLRLQRPLPNALLHMSDPERV